MGVQKISADTEIKEWKKPELKVLDISATQFGQQGENDGNGFGEGIPPLS